MKKIASCSCCFCVFGLANLIFIFLWCPFIVRVINVSVVRERDIDLLATQRRTVLLQSLKVTALYECSVRSTICRTLVLPHLTSDLFELHRSLVRINFLLAEIFRTSSPWNLTTFNRTSGLQDSLALGLQNLHVFGPMRRSSELLSSESSALVQKHDLQMLGLFIRTSCLRVFRGILANLQSLLTMMIF